MVKESLTSRSIRNNNSYNILKALVEHEKLQRSELTAFSNVSVITVKKIVDELLATGILEETTVTSSIGRKPKELSFMQNLGCFCCVNLCKTSQIGYFIYDIHSRLLSRGKVRTSRNSNFSGALEECIRQIRRAAAEELKLPLLGAAVSVPSIYYEEEDAVNCDLIPGLQDIHLKALLTEALGIRNIVIIHDVCAAAGLEYQLADSDSLYYFYVGDGLGSAFVRYGEVFQGDSYAAGEIGQCLADLDGSEESYESILSISGLCGRLGLSDPGELDEVLRKYPNLPENQRDNLEKVFTFAAGMLYNICWLLNPGTIVVDSGLPALAELIQAETKKKCDFLSKSPIRNSVKVTLPKEQNHYAMSGCVLLLVDNWIEGVLGGV
jgi:predicted NBD/HSP70 family sugar kinase/predicted transcriptional regulator